MRRLIKSALMGATMLISMAAPSFASETKTWTTTANGWSVDIHDDGTCTTDRRYPHGTRLMFGWRRDRDGSGEGGIWIGFGHADWHDKVVNDKIYDVTMVTDGKSWKPVHFGGFVSKTDGAFLSEGTFSSTFIGAVAAGSRIEFWTGGDWLTKLTLDGSREAIDQLLECQKAQNARTSQASPPGSSVPFNGSGVTPRSDPGDAASWSVPIVRNGSNIRLQASINSGAATSWMLDTGATIVSITQETADALGLKPIRRVELTYGDGRKGTEAIVVIDKLQIGDVFLRNVEATVGGKVNLIGKNFLDSFSSYQIDNATSLLILKK